MEISSTDDYSYNYTHTILPIIEEKLNTWYNLASKIKEKNKSKIAKDSIKNKKIHSYGGASLASDMNYKESLSFIDLLIALTLILDYTDNIIEIENLSFKQAFHLSESLVLPLEGEQKESFSEKLESLSLEYLNKLTETVSKNINNVKNYRFLRKRIVSHMRVFAISQAISSEKKSQRDKIYKDWFYSQKQNPENLKWNEFAAAQASPLIAYSLLRYSYRDSISFNEAKQLINTYKFFGIINVLGDHIIDEENDKKNQEINHISEFNTKKEAIKRFIRIVNFAENYISRLQNKDYHYFVLKVLLNMYMEPLKKNNDWGYFSKKICNDYFLPIIIN